jgi:hypothetical protein
LNKLFILKNIRIINLQKYVKSKIITIKNHKNFKKIYSSLKWLIVGDSKNFETNKIVKNVTGNKQNNDLITVKNKECYKKSHIIKTPSKEVIEITKELKNKIGISQKNPDICLSKKSNTNIESEKYILFKKFIIENSGNDGKIPNANSIEMGLKITRKEREELQEIALKENLLIAVSERKKIINKEYL